MKHVWIAIVRLFGWKYDIPEPGTRPEVKRCVIVEAPHTSIYDFLLGATCVWKLKTEARFFIKDGFFNWFTRPFLNWAGAIPVDRGNRKNHLVDQALELYEKYPEFSMIITPEGTRKKVHRWKRGFYEIATQAGVPIVLSFIDYKKRCMGLGPTIYPSGDFNKDMVQIMSFYKNINARHPEKFNSDVSIYEEKNEK